MPIIKQIEVTVTRVPLHNPVAFSNRVVQAREYCLVRVFSDNGTTGIGYSYAVNTSGRILAAAIEEVFAPILLERDSLEVELLWKEMYQEALLIGRAGAAMRALSAVDIALWDLNARSVALPLYKYMGAAKQGRVPTYGSGGYYQPHKTIDDLCSEMLSFVQVGHKAVKMKVGRLTPAKDAERVGAVRDAIGPDILLMLDANNAWRDLPMALTALRPLERFEPFWIEEPFSPDDIDNHAALARNTSIQVATGEVEAGRWRFKELMDKRAASILQTDAIVCGGITEWRRIAATASSYGIPVAPHAWHDVHAHLVASADNAPYAEYMPDDSIVNFRNVIDIQMELEDGDLIISDRPGLGFNFDEEKVKDYGWKEGNRGPWLVMKNEDMK